MAHLVLVRHGKAAAGFDADPDPGLDDEGMGHAAAVADALGLFGPFPIYTSPRRRTQETAAALADRWGVEPIIEPGIGEVVAPMDDLAERGRWLRRVMASRWSEQEEALQAWRADVLDTVRRTASRGEAVLVTHFIAINVVVGAATGEDRVVSFSPGYCSRTEVKVDGDDIELVELGGAAPTVVLPG